MNEPAHPPTFLPLRPYQEYPVPEMHEMHEMHERSRALAAELQRRAPCGSSATARSRRR